MTESTIEAPDQAAPSAAMPGASELEVRAGSRVIGRLFAVGIALSTMVLLITLAVLLLMTPLYMHDALDRAGSPGYLGVTAAEAHAFSDATVAELLAGPGTFAFPFGEGGPTFYDASEASHMRDARAVLYGLLALTGLALVVLGVGLARSRRQAGYWRAVAAGSGVIVVAFVVIGLLFMIAFDAAFTLFHQLFFPGGNWAFDFATQRMVQLYPIPFWQEATTVMGAIVVVVGSLVWWLSRRHARRLAAGEAP
jgi:integral membrane protein (TIGR01906 family)